MTNITDDGLQRYLQVFHETYRETAEEFIPTIFRPKLFRWNILPAEVTGYISTQFGTGYKYGESGTFTVRVERSSRRIEDALFEVPTRFRHLEECLSLNGQNEVDIYGFKCRGGFPLRIQDVGVLRLTNFLTQIGNWRKIVRYGELYSDRSAERWSEAKAVARAKDEILRAVVDLQQLTSLKVSHLSDYLSVYKPRRVVVLGDFQPEGRRRLDEIKDNLTQLRYYPVLVDEVEDIPHFDLGQKLVAIGSSSRFVVMDDSSRSGHLAEFPQIVHEGWYVIVLRLKGSHSSYMTRGVAGRLQTMVEFDYEPDDLPWTLAKAVGQIESRIGARSAELSNIFPWDPKESKPQSPDAP